MRQPDTIRTAGHQRLPAWILRLVTLGLAAALVAGCGTPPQVLTTPGNPVDVGELFPAALLAEPVQLRAGYVHTTQPFQIKGPKERWAVSLGFVRTDGSLTPEQRLTGASNRCWTDSPKSPIHLKTCKVNSPGFHVRWELLREDGTIVKQHTFDTLVANTGGTSGGDAITSTLSGFSDQLPGVYRLRVTVLREARELDFLKPHILVNRPFFNSRAIE